jgi:hypothetical protein
MQVFVNVLINKMMKKLFIFCAIIFLFACQKENTPPREYITYSFKIVSPKNQTPLTNYNLLFFKSTWIDYRTMIDTLMGYAATDNQGNVSFTFKASTIINKPNVKYRIQNYYPDSLPFDSTNNNFRYDIFEEIEENDKKRIEAYCRCSLNVTLEHEKYMAMGIDSLYLETPAEKFKNINNSVDHTVGSLECSENVLLKYYYYVKGVKSKEYTKNIFIGRSNLYKSETVCELEF